MLTYFLVASLLADAAIPPRYLALSGDCNIILNQGVATSATVIPTTCSQFSKESGNSIATSLAKIERFVEASNPTTVDLQSATVEHWVSDPEDYLTLVLSNPSKLPAIRLRVGILAPLEPGQRHSRRLTFTPSREFSAPMMRSLSISAGGTLRLPIAPMPEVIRRFAGDLSPSYVLLAVGTTPDAPSDVVTKFQACHEINGGSYIQLKSRSLGVQITYKNIFDGRSANLRGVYLYFAKDNRAPEGEPPAPCPAG